MIMASSNESSTTTNEREEKRLRSCEPDLKVILGSGEGESIQWYHTPTLASKSKYIDTMLAVPMKESTDSVISFPDITPDIWAKMLKFLDNPIAVREMTAKDAVEIVAFYDKYEFVEGVKLCSYVMMDYLSDDSLDKMEKSFSLDNDNIDLIVNSVVTAHKANLEDVYKKGMKYILDKFKSPAELGFLTPYGRLMFTESHLEKLAPAFSYCKERSGDNHNWRRLELPYPPFSEWQVKQPYFAKESIVEGQLEQILSLWDSCILHIKICDSLKCDGTYEKSVGVGEVLDTYKPTDYFTGSASRRWGDENVDYRVQYWVPQYDYDGTEPDSKDKFKGWAIIRKYPPTEGNRHGRKKRCWIALHSENLKLPPLKGWVPDSDDPNATGNPSIRYILDSKEIKAKTW